MTGASAATPARAPIWLLIICAAIGPMAVTIALPANTQIMSDFGTSYGIAQLMLTVYLALMGVALLFMGFLSDRFGRRPLMFWGMAIFAAGSAMTMLAGSIEWLLIGRAIQGLGAATGQALARATIRDMFGRDRAASMLGYVTVPAVIAPMLGPSIGGLLIEWFSWRYIFALLTVLAATVMVLIWRFLPETGAASIARRPRLVKSTLTLVAMADFRRYALILVFAVGMYWAFQAAAPFLMMEVMQRAPSEYGLYFIITAIGYGSGNLMSGRFAERFGTDRMLRMALIPGLLGMALFWWFADVLHPLALFGPMFLITVSNGLTIPNATSGALSARPELAGTAAGITGFLQAITGTIISLVVGFVQDGSFKPLLITMSVCILISAASVATTIRRKPASQEPV